MRPSDRVAPPGRPSTTSGRTAGAVPPTGDAATRSGQATEVGSYRGRGVRVALLGADAGAGGAADAQLLVRQRHHLFLVLVVVIVVLVDVHVFAVLVEADEFEHAARAHLEAAAAADALFFVQRGHEGRRPSGAAGQGHVEGLAHGVLSVGAGSVRGRGVELADAQLEFVGGYAHGQAPYCATSG